MASTCLHDTPRRYPGDYVGGPLEMPFTRAVRAARAQRNPGGAANGA